MIFASSAFTPKIKSKCLSYFSPPNNDRKFSTFTTQSTTFSAQKTTRSTTHFQKYPSKTPIKHQNPPSPPRPTFSAKNPL
jgi:hypothetical protein